MVGRRTAAGSMAGTAEYLITRPLMIRLSPSRNVSRSVLIGATPLLVLNTILSAFAVTSS